MLPWALSHTSADTAYGHRPLAAIIQDVLSLLIYFSCVSLVAVYGSVIY